MNDEIKEAAEKWWYKPLTDTMNSDGTFDKDMFRYKDLGKHNGISGFTAGANYANEKCQEEIINLTKENNRYFLILQNRDDKIIELEEEIKQLKAENEIICGEIKTYLKMFNDSQKAIKGE